MARYIDADALMERCFARLKDGEVLYRVSPQDIIETPTADVVEVVRCRDCKYWGGSTFGYVCEAWSGMDLKHHTRPNDFCSYGERKEQNNG